MKRTLESNEESALELVWLQMLQRDAVLESRSKDGAVSLFQGCTDLFIML